MSEHRVVNCPPAPVILLETDEKPSLKRTQEESNYLQEICDEVVKTMETLPYGGIIEVRGFRPNPVRNVEYNNSGSRRDPSKDYESNRDITCLRSRIRRTWSKRHPGDVLGIQWSEDDSGSRRLVMNADRKTIHMSVERKHR
jgi:hypothetical protein